ncbi:hypothetical protein R3B00_001301 [Klebsiella pneumoniae]|nr:hypothetical protein [Klebsiella pneumoniae]ELQ8980639.1 hypothetical protein [Klebsiella pneumoniae]
MHTIQTESEFKAACIADGDKVLAILRFMQEELKEKHINIDDQSERTKVYHQYHNLGKIIQTVQNESFPLEPSFN